MSEVNRYWCSGPWLTRDFKLCVLASDYDALKAERDEARDLYADSSDNAAMYLAEIERLREVLENVQHGTVCPAHPGWLNAGPCTCGLDAALAPQESPK